MEFRSTVLFLILSICILLYVRALLRRRQNSVGIPYHPGPKPRLIIENLLDVPTKEPYKEYSKWSTLYGSDVVSFHLPGSHTVIVNSAKAAKALFEKRSAIYSDRPYFKMVYLMGWDFNIAPMGYSDSWRAHRRIIHQYFRPDAVTEYHPLLSSRVRTVLKTLLDQPGEPYDQLRDYVGSLPLKLAYDLDVMNQSHPLIKRVEKAVAMLAGVLYPGARLVNSFPLLNQFPEAVPGISGFKREARECRVLTDEIQGGPFNKIKENMAKDPTEVHPSLLAKILRRNSREGGGELGEYVIRRSMATVHIGASDTSMSAVTTGILALLLNPSVQYRGQEQIDIVVGRRRLPSFSDRDQLPYITAICREIMRWKLVLPLGVYHASTEDDVYDGYFIPKGSTVIGNAWAILHDPEIYPDPDSYSPDRFITSEGMLSEDDVLYSFGFGRRLCPGRRFANDSLWITIASILAVFNIVPAKDSKGKNVDVTPEYVDSFVSHPLPFRCSMFPRDAEAEALIRSDNEEDYN